MIKLIVGLGNPGLEYEKTRHNVGAWFVKQIADQAHASWQLQKKFHGLIAEVSIADQRCRLLMPTTYMNDSGRAILAMANFYDIKPSEILIAHDELDFPCGVARLKKDGGHGGHNGLRDTISCLNSAEFARLRLGIGHPGTQADVSDYVLHAPTGAQQREIEQAIDASLKVLPLLVTNEWQRAVQQLHE